MILDIKPPVYRGFDYKLKVIIKYINFKEYTSDNREILIFECFLKLQFIISTNLLKALFDKLYCKYIDNNISIDVNVIINTIYYKSH